MCWIFPIFPTERKYRSWSRTRSCVFSKCLALPWSSVFPNPSNIYIYIYSVCSFILLLTVLHTHTFYVHLSYILEMVLIHIHIIRYTLFWALNGPWNSEEDRNMIWCLMVNWRPRLTAFQEFRHKNTHTHVETDKLRDSFRDTACWTLIFLWERNLIKKIIKNRFLIFFYKLNLALVFIKRVTCHGVWSWIFGGTHIFTWF